MMVVSSCMTGRSASEFVAIEFELRILPGRRGILRVIGATLVLLWWLVVIQKKLSSERVRGRSLSRFTVSLLDDLNLLHQTPASSLPLLISWDPVTYRG